MSEQTGKAMLLTMFFLAIAIVAWDDIKHGGVWPRPRRFMGAGAVFGILGLVTPFVGAQVTGIFGAGMVLALFYKGVVGIGGTAAGAIGQGAIGGATAGAGSSPSGCDAGPR